MGKVKRILKHAEENIFVIIFLIVLCISCVALIPVGFINLIRFYFFNDTAKNIIEDLKRSPHLKIHQFKIKSNQWEGRGPSFELNGHTLPKFDYFRPTELFFYNGSDEAKSFYIESHIKEKEFPSYVEWINKSATKLRAFPHFNLEMEYRGGEYFLRDAVWYVILISPIAYILTF